MISDMAGGILIHDIHNHTFRNHHLLHHHPNNKTNNNNYNINYQQHIRSDGDINGNEMIRITENPLPPPPVNAACEDYIR